VGFAIGLAAAGAGMAHSVGRSHGAPTYKAAPMVDGAVADPATLVPLTLGPPTREADELLGKQMMRFGIALERLSRADAAAARDLADVEATLTGAEVQSVLGPDAAASLRQVVSVLKESAASPPLDQPSVTAIDLTIARLDNSLLAARMPYFVDATVMTEMRGKAGPRRIILLSAFSVAQSNLYASDDGARVRTVRVRRLDRLNYKHASLGFVNPHRAQATVLLDVVDEQLERHLLPALAERTPMPLTISDGAGGPAIARLAARAGENARVELGTVPGIDRDGLYDLGAALHERRALHEKWNSPRQALGLGLRVPTGLAFDLATVEGQVEAAELDGLKAIQARLEAEASATAYTVLRDAFADSIERHEVQHRLDLMQATIEPLPTPAPVTECIRGEGPGADELRDALKNELSGYVAQIAREDRIPRTVLTLLLRFLVNPRTRTSTEAYVAAITAEELCRVLHIGDVSPIMRNGRLDEERLARAHRELTSVAPRDLARAAASVWARLFGRRLPVLRRVG
jgi:hypothetical protein